MQFFSSVAGFRPQYAHQRPLGGQRHRPDPGELFEASVFAQRTRQLRIDRSRNMSGPCVL